MAGVTPSSQGRRIALVIGNSAYQHPENLPKLVNPAHDAEDIAAALRRFGFEVIERRNQTLEAMHQSIAEFGSRIGGSEAALFFFAGHGIQVRNQNYLMPVNAKVESEAMVPYQGVNVNQILDEMDNARSRVNIVILDACRNNPVSGKFRSGRARGLASPDIVPKGTVIVYATDPGNVAADGDGRNGLLTAGLLTAFQGRDLSLDGVLTIASAEVERASRQTQTPYVNGPKTLQKNFSFNVAMAPDPTETETRFWNEAKASGTREAFEAYLKRFPSGTHVALARGELRKWEEPERASKPQEGIERKGVGGTVPARTEKTQKNSAPVLAPVDKPDIKVGDRWVYRNINLWKNEESASVELKVAAIKGDTMTVDRTLIDSKGAAGAGIERSSRRTADRSTWTLLDPNVTHGKRLTLLFPLEVGKTWDFEYSIKRPDGDVVTHKRSARVEAWEDVEVPAGRFRALRVVHSGRTERPGRAGPMSSGNVSETFWYAPEIRSMVKHEYHDTMGHLRTRDQFRQELTAYDIK